MFYFISRFPGGSNLDHCHGPSCQPMFSLLPYLFPLQPQVAPDKALFYVSHCLNLADSDAQMYFSEYVNERDPLTYNSPFSSKLHHWHPQRQSTVPTTTHLVDMILMLALKVFLHIPWKYTLQSSIPPHPPHIYILKQKKPYPTSFPFPILSTLSILFCSIAFKKCWSQPTKLISDQTLIHQTPPFIHTEHSLLFLPSTCHNS